MILPYVVIGVVSGSVYALAALGLTLTYKTTGIFNFANGAIAAAAAYVFYSLHDISHVSWGVAAAIVVLGFGVVVGLVLERLGRGLARVSTTMQIVATVGLMVGAQALLVVKYGAATISFQTPLPVDPHRILGVVVTTDELITTGVVLALAIALWLTLRFSPLGVTTRAVIDDPELLQHAGRDPNGPRRWSWCIASCFAALSGLLGAASTGILDSTILTLIMLNALGAAAIGGLRNLPLTYVGGLVVGVVAALTTKYVGTSAIGTSSPLSALPQVSPFIILLVVLLVIPPRRLVSQTRVRLRPPRMPRSAPRPVLVGGGVLGGALVLLAPQIAGTSRLPSLSAGLASVILLLSLGLLVRLSGQVSLCQYGLAAVGAAAFSHLASGAGLPWVLAVLAAGLVAVPVGAMIAIPAIRLSGLFLALATFGFGIGLSELFYQSSAMFGTAGGVPAPRPGFASGSLGYYYVLCVAVALACAVVFAIDRSRLGRLLRGMAGSPVALTTYGTNIKVTKVIVFCISAFLAGVSGALLGPVTGTVAGTSFDPVASLTLLAILAISGHGKVRYAFMGAIALELIPSYITNGQVTNALPALFGVSAIVAALRSGAEPAWSRLRWLRERQRDGGGGTTGSDPEASGTSRRAATSDALIDA